jgi:hypothetical protein
MPRLIVTFLAALLLSTLAVAASEADQRPVIRVHVIAGPAASGNAAATVDGLEDSTADLREALGKRKGLTIVPAADEAQVRVEVVDREERDPAQGGFGGTSITKFRQTIVRLRIESGAARSELKGIGQSSWKAAAKDAAERISKWLESHPPAGTTQPTHQ